MKPTPSHPWPEDLSARSRRGQASIEEERELARALDSSATLRVAHQVGLDLDRSTAVRAGDEELVLAAADAALDRVSSAPPAAAASAQRALRPSGPATRFARGEYAGAAASFSPPSRVVLRAGSRKSPRKIAAALVAAATISASGMAAALWAGIAKVPWHVDAPAPAEAPPAAPRKVHAVRTKAPAEIPQVVEEATPEPALAAEAVPAPEIARATEAKTKERALRRTNHVGEPAPAELFRSANAARRAGDFGEARRLYSRLIAKYPGTDEARLSQVSLGKLLLASGEAAEAEREFRRYLSNGRQPLDEEALVSQAESLRAMNRGTDERKTWQRLLTQHPNSLYAARARARLSALDRESPVSGP